jgi:hypothetical protein
MEPYFFSNFLFFGRQGRHNGGYFTGAPPLPPPFSISHNPANLGPSLGCLASRGSPAIVNLVINQSQKY